MNTTSYWYEYVILFWRSVHDVNPRVAILIPNQLLSGRSIPQCRHQTRSRAMRTHHWYILPEAEPFVHDVLTS